MLLALLVACLVGCKPKINESRLFRTGQAYEIRTASFSARAVVLDESRQWVHLDFGRSPTDGEASVVLLRENEIQWFGPVAAKPSLLKP